MQFPPFLKHLPLREAADPSLARAFKLAQFMILDLASWSSPYAALRICGPSCSHPSFDLGTGTDKGTRSPASCWNMRQTLKLQVDRAGPDEFHSCCCDAARWSLLAHVSVDSRTLHFPSQFAAFQCSTALQCTGMRNYNCCIVQLLATAKL